MMDIVKKFIENTPNWQEKSIDFYKANQLHPFHFGKYIYINIGHDEVKSRRFLDIVVNYISQGEEGKKDLQVIGGFIIILDLKTKEQFFDRLKFVPSFAWYLFYFYSLEPPSHDRIQDLRHVCDYHNAWHDDSLIKEFEFFEDKNYLQNFSEEEIIDFCSLLFQGGVKGYWIAFRLLQPLYDPDDNSLRQTIYIRTWLVACIEKLELKSDDYPALSAKMLKAGETWPSTSPSLPH